MDPLLLPFFFLYPQKFSFSQANLSLFQHVEKPLLVLCGKVWPDTDCHVRSKRLVPAAAEIAGAGLDACAWDAPLAGQEVPKQQPPALGSELCSMVQTHSPSPIHCL